MLKLEMKVRTKTSWVAINAATLCLSVVLTFVGGLTIIDLLQPR